jgi:hypothetical protein
VFEAAQAFIADVRAGKPVRARREQVPARS